MNLLSTLSFALWQRDACYPPNISAREVYQTTPLGTMAWQALSTPTLLALFADTLVSISRLDEYTLF